MFGFNPTPPEGGPVVARLQAHFFPRITLQEHERAKSHIAAERQKFVLIEFPSGAKVPFYTGEISWRDLQAAHGYGCRPSDLDRFGWPKGHPESPANLGTPS